MKEIAESFVVSMSGFKVETDSIESSISSDNRNSSKLIFIGWLRSGIKSRFLPASRGSHNNTFCDAMFKLYWEAGSCFHFWRKLFKAMRVSSCGVGSSIFSEKCLFFESISIF